MHKENFLNHYFYQLRASAGLKIPAPFTPTATRSAGVKTPAPFTSTSNALQYQQPATRHNTQNRIPHTIKYHQGKKKLPLSQPPVQSATLVVQEKREVLGGRETTLRK